MIEEQNDKIGEQIRKDQQGPIAGAASKSLNEVQPLPPPPPTGKTVPRRRTRPRRRGKPTSNGSRWMQLSCGSTPQACRPPLQNNKKH